MSATRNRATVRCYALGLLVALALLTPAIWARPAQAEAESTSQTISLPDTRPVFLSVEVNGEETEIINLPGAQDQSVTITVSAATTTDVALATSPACEGTLVDQRVGLTIGGDSASVTITRTFTPVDPEDGTAGSPTTETLVSLPLGPAPQNTVGVNLCA